MDLSVLIPTHRRHAKLAACVRALARQSLPGDRFEVLVGTDGPDEQAYAAAHQAWESARGRKGGLTIIQCAKAGPGPTRNRLIMQAAAGTILLLNDDVVPDERLLEMHTRAHRELAGGGRFSRAMILGSAPWAVPAPDRLFDRLIRETSMVFFYDQMTGDDPERDWGFRHAWTLNLSLPTDAARAVGGFDAALRCACFEDLEFAWRLAKQQGLPVLYRPGAVVTHDHQYEPAGYLEREETLGRESHALALAAPGCARDVFGRDVASEGELAYSREFVERERSAAARLESSFMGLADIPASAVAGPRASRIIRVIYEQHLLLKRWRWRKGLLDAAGAPV